MSEQPTMTDYDRMKADPRSAALLGHEERKLAVIERLAEMGFHVPDDEDLDRLLDALAAHMLGLPSRAVHPLLAADRLCAAADAAVVVLRGMPNHEAAAEVLSEASDDYRTARFIAQDGESLLVEAMKGEGDRES